MQIKQTVLRSVVGPIAAIAMLGFGLAGAALAQEIRAGDLVITQAWARATPGGAKVGGAYLTIENKGATADRLIGGSADVAGKVEVHEMATKDGVMTMRSLDKRADHRPRQDGKARAGRISFDDVRSEEPAAAG